MVLSFTENFQRVGFSPVEEARFFYNALDIKDISNIGNLHSEDGETRYVKTFPKSTVVLSVNYFLISFYWNKGLLCCVYWFLD